jgi:hypothetical protein
MGRKVTLVVLRSDDTERTQGAQKSKRTHTRESASEQNSHRAPDLSDAVCTR